MQKNTNEELGTLLTREMLTMMFDNNLKAEQKVHIFCAIVGDEKVKDVVLASYANALRIGYIHANSARIASIQARRERQKEYQRNLRASTEINRDIRAFPIEGKGNGKGNIPPTPKGVGRVPSKVSPEEIMSECGERCAWCDEEGFCTTGNSSGSHCCNCADKVPQECFAAQYADEIISWYPYKVNPVGLKKTILVEVKKFSARALSDGIAAWRNSGAWDESRFIPRKIMAWISGGGYREDPPKKSSAARTDGGRALAAPSSDATMRMIQSGKDEE